MARLSAVLIADTDPRGLEVLLYGFEGQGCRVDSVSDLAQAAETAKTSDAQVLVVSLRDGSPEDLAEDLAQVRRLRANPSTDRLPFLVLGADPAREQLKDVGGLYFLPSPVFVRDVITACRILVALRISDGGAAGDTELQGALSDYGLFFLVRTMLGLGASGILQVERANRRGEIRFRQGEVTSAEVGSLHGFPALHHLLLWEEAALDLKFRSVVRGGQFRKKAEDLIEDSERFLRDFAHATRDLGSVQAIFQATSPKAGDPTDLIPAEVVPVVKLFDGQRSLGDVIEDSPFRVFDTLRIVSRMAEVGVLHRQPAGPSSATPAPAGGVPRAQDWLEQPRGGGAMHGTVRTEQRSTGSGKRKGARRDKTTSELGTIPANKPAAPAAQTPAPQTPERQPEAPVATVDVNVSGEIRATKRKQPAVAAGPSFVVDLGPEGEGIEPSAPVPVAVASEDSIPTVPVPTPIRIPTPIPLPAPVAPAAAPVPLAETLGPSRASTGSIEIDPSLMAEMDALEMANTPATPAPLLLPFTAQRPAAPAAPEVVSFVKPEPAPTPAAPAPMTPSRPISVRRATPVPPSDEERARHGRRPSGEFNAVEADFFAREAELYKREKEDNFEDLDRSQPGPKRR